MSRNGQLEELCRVYAEMSEEELLALFEDRDDLTETAQQALTQVMAERGLKAAADGGPDTTPGGPFGYHAAEVPLWTFDDAFQAKEAIRLLDEAEIWHRVEDASGMTGENLRDRQLRPGLAVIVRRQDEESAIELLQKKMNLFPAAATQWVAGSPLAEMEDLSLVAIFDRTQAFIAAMALGQSGISYFWRDGRDREQQLDDEDTVGIEVRTPQLKVATELIERRFAEEV